jgi:hypothetical protein
VIDTAYQIFKNGDAYKVRITHLGNSFRKHGFVSLADAESWVAEVGVSPLWTSARSRVTRRIYGSFEP